MVYELRVTMTDDYENFSELLTEEDWDVVFERLCQSLGVWLELEHPGSSFTMYCHKIDSDFEVNVWIRDEEGKIQDPPDYYTGDWVQWYPSMEDVPESKLSDSERVELTARRILNSIYHRWEAFEPECPFSAEAHLRKIGVLPKAVESNSG